MRTPAFHTVAQDLRELAIQICSSDLYSVHTKMGSLFQCAGRSGSWACASSTAFKAC